MLYITKPIKKKKIRSSNTHQHNTIINSHKYVITTSAFRTHHTLINCMSRHTHHSTTVAPPIVYANISDTLAGHNTSAIQNDGRKLVDDLQEILQYSM